MATFYVSQQNGSDSNDGTTEAQAKATIQAGLNLISNGSSDILYIGPGTYREPLALVGGYDGASEANPIKVIGDLNCEFLTQDSPGYVRITSASSSEEWPALTGTASETNHMIDVYGNSFWEFHNLHFDGQADTTLAAGNCYVAYGNLAGGDIVKFINCSMLNLSKYGVNQVVLDNCLIQAGYSAAVNTQASNSVFISAFYPSYGATLPGLASLTSCILIGGYATAIRTHLYNCIGVGSLYGFYTSDVNNSAHYASFYGLAYNNDANAAAKINNSFASNNYYLSRLCENSTTGFYDVSLFKTYENTLTNWTARPLLRWDPFTFKTNIQKAFKPLGFEGISGIGDASLSSSLSSDILGLPTSGVNNNKMIGPYIVSPIQEKFENTYYNLSAPGFFFENTSYKGFDVVSSTGSFTVSAYAKVFGTPVAKPARMRIYGSGITADTDSMGGNTWEILTVSSSITGSDQKFTLELGCMEDGVSAAFSDIKVYYV